MQKKKKNFTLNCKIRGFFFGSIVESFALSKDEIRSMSDSRLEIKFTEIKYKISIKRNFHIPDVLTCGCPSKCCAAKRPSKAGGTDHTYTETSLGENSSNYKKILHNTIKKKKKIKISTTKDTNGKKLCRDPNFDPLSIWVGSDLNTGKFMSFILKDPNT